MVVQFAIYKLTVSLYGRVVSQLFVIFVEKKTVTKDVVIQVYRLLGVRFP